MGEAEKVLNLMQTHGLQVHILSPLQHRPPPIPIKMHLSIRRSKCMADHYIRPVKRSPVPMGDPKEPDRDIRRTAAHLLKRALVNSNPIPE